MSQHIPGGRPRVALGALTALVLVVALWTPDRPAAQTPAPASVPLTLTVSADRPGPRIDPIFYGLMTEEINFSYDGGLYAELIRNRTFRDDPKEAVHWSVVKYNGGDGAIALENSPVPGTALTMALRLDATGMAGSQRVGVANGGFWGIPVRPNTTYRASFYAKASASFRGPLTVGIESADGTTTLASSRVSGLSQD